MPDLLVSELCTICRIHPPKYCCPRCLARTCSLPCSKRHKQWSQCNGIRDPSRSYVKRSDLATPAGIDHDYNYLTSIERQIDIAERDARERGFVLEDENTKTLEWKRQGLDGPKKGEMSTKEALEKSGAIIERAPEGMARRRQNATKWDRKRHRIVWTVEWIHDDGRKELRLCPESNSILDAYITHARPTTTKEDTKGQFEARPNKRRKHKTKAKPSWLASNSNSAQDSTQGASVAEAITQKSGSVIPLETSHGTSTEGITNSGLDEAIVPAIDIASNSQTTNSPKAVAFLPRGSISDPSPDSLDALSNAEASKDPDKTQNKKISSQPPVEVLHFYLHAPRLPSAQLVLIPLSPESSLSECLLSRLVREFPTIYVLANPPSELPDSYITEEEFDKQMQNEGFKDSVMAKLTGNEEGEIEEDLGQQEDVDAKKIEEVLQRDLKWFQGYA